MTDQLISFETSKLAHEKGFNLTVLAGSDTSMLISTQSLLQKWLREIHMINVLVQEPTTRLFRYRTVFGKIGRRLDISTGTSYTSCYNVYEEALEAGLYQALLLIK